MPLAVDVLEPELFLGVPLDLSLVLFGEVNFSPIVGQVAADLLLANRRGEWIELEADAEMKKRLRPTFPSGWCVLDVDIDSHNELTTVALGRDLDRTTIFTHV